MAEPDRKSALLGVTRPPSRIIDVSSIRPEAQANDPVVGAVAPTIEPPKEASAPADTAAPAPDEVSAKPERSARKAEKAAPQGEQKEAVTRTTISFPDELVSALRMKALRERTTMNELLLVAARKIVAKEPR